MLISFTPGKLTKENTEKYKENGDVDDSSEIKQMPP